MRQKPPESAPETLYPPRSRHYTLLVSIYSDLAKNPGVIRVIISQLLARLPFGMLSIILLLHIQTRFGDYTSAGIVLAAESVGQAVAGPLTSRLMGRWGMRPVLTATSVVCAALLAVIGVAHLPLAVIAVLAALMGIATPPVTPAVRTLYPKLVPGNQLSALFSLDAAAQEVIWVIGPVVAVFVSAQFGTAVGLCFASAIMLLGGVWFVLSPAVGKVRIPKSRSNLGAVLLRPTVVISTVVGFFFVAAFAAIEAGIVAAFRHAGEGGHNSIESGIVLGVFSIGSLVGGLVIGHRPMRPWSLLLRILVVLAGTAACLVSLNIWWLSLVLFIGGLGTAPAFAAISAIVSSTVKFSEAAEAFGWVGTGQLVGVAVGSAVAGVAIDAAGPEGAVLVSAGLLLAAAICSAATMRRLPDLKGRDIEPLPETGTLAIPLP